MWQHSDQYWDPNYSDNPLLDASGDHRDKNLTADITVDDFATSGGHDFTTARIDPDFVEFLQAFIDEVAARNDTGDDMEFVISSGYRPWKHNREVYGWPADTSRVESIEREVTVENDGGEDVDDERFSLGLAVSYEIDLWGRIRSRAQAEAFRSQVPEEAQEAFHGELRSYCSR